VVVLVMILLGAIVIAAAMFHGLPMAVAPPKFIAANAVLAFVSSIAGGALTARVAPSRPIYHAAGLGVALLSIGVFALIFPSPQSLVPNWYEPLVAVLGAIGAVVGGMLVRDAKNLTT
jgi:peptidoglycan/LPS O-acetylase OafA/YrhL